MSRRLASVKALPRPKRRSVTLSPYDDALLDAWAYVEGPNYLSDEFLWTHHDHCICDKRQPPHAPHQHATTVAVAS